MWERHGFFYKYALKRSRKRRGIRMCAKLDELKGVSAEEILERAGQKESVPVDMDRIFDTIGIYKQERDFSDIEEIEKKGKISGLVVIMGNDVKIFFSEKDGIRKKRLTAAHEVGHCCLHGDSLLNDYIEFLHKDGFENKHEKEASIFASRLLVPSRSLKMIYERLAKPTVKNLSEIFQVPKKIMKIRLKEEGLRV